MVVVIDIVSVHYLSIDMHHRNQCNRSKPVMHYFHFNNCLEQLGVSVIKVGVVYIHQGKKKS